MKRYLLVAIMLAMPGAYADQVTNGVCHQVCYRPLVWVVNHYEQGPLQCYCNWSNH